MQEAEIDKPGNCKGDNGRLRRTRVGPGLSQETWQHGSWVSAYAVLVATSALQELEAPPEWQHNCYNKTQLTAVCPH